MHLIKLTSNNRCFRSTKIYEETKALSTMKSFYTTLSTVKSYYLKHSILKRDDV